MLFYFQSFESHVWAGKMPGFVKAVKGISPVEKKKKKINVTHGKSLFWVIKMKENAYERPN